MPKGRRRESGTELYHVMAKGINRERIFNQHWEKIYFKKIVREHLEKSKVEIYAYCIMSTHVHFIIRAELHELSAFMAGILAEYASYYNFKHSRNGHVFQNRFLSECIEDKTYFWNCLRYIHLNPVKANMIKTPEKYKYSSMKEYFSGEQDLLHKKAFLLYGKQFSDSETFTEYHGEPTYKVFLDTEEEEFLQQVEIAFELAVRTFEKNDLTALRRVFEEKNLREEYIREIRQTLNVSWPRAKELCMTVRAKVKDK